MGGGKDELIDLNECPTGGGSMISMYLYNTHTQIRRKGVGREERKGEEAPRGKGVTVGEK